MYGILSLTRNTAQKCEFRSQITEPSHCIRTTATHTFNTRFIYYNETNFKTHFPALTRIWWFVVQLMKFEEMNKKAI